MFIFFRKNSEFPQDDGEEYAVLYTTPPTLVIKKGQNIEVVSEKGSATVKGVSCSKTSAVGTKKKVIALIEEAKKFT